MTIREAFSHNHDRSPTMRGGRTKVQLTPRIYVRGSRQFLHLRGEAITFEVGSVGELRRKLAEVRRIVEGR
jgi:hypothetical protein